MIRLLPDKSLSKEVWKLAGPVVIGMVSQTLLNLVDTAMVGRLGATALAATGLGGILSWLILGTLSALAIGSQAISARRLGEGEKLKAGKVFDNTLFSALVVGLFGSLFIAPFMRWIYAFFTVDSSVIEVGRGYLYFRLLGIFPFMIIAAHRGFFNGIGQTGMHMRVAILINMSNILFNYLLIFGKMGFPRLESAGAGLSSSIATLVGSIFFISISLQKKWRIEYNLWKISNISFGIIKSVLKLAIPSAMHSFTIMLGFSIFNTIVSRIGVVEMAATNVCITIMSFSFLPGAGIGTAAGTLIGQKLGEKRPDLAEAYGWEAAKIGMYLMSTLGIVFFIFPEIILRVFTDDLAVIEAGKLPLRIIGLVQAFDAMGMVFSMALEGAGLNRWVFITEAMIHWGLFLPATWILAMWMDMNLIGAWIAFATYLLIYGITVSWKFHQGSWKKVKV